MRARRTAPAPRPGEPGARVDRPLRRASLPGDLNRLRRAREQAPDRVVAAVAHHGAVRMARRVASVPWISTVAERRRPRVDRVPLGRTVSPATGHRATGRPAPPG